MVHQFDNWDWQAGDGVDYHCTWDELRDRTLSLFSITRNAILYFNAAIHLDEIKHYQTNSREKVYTRHYYFHNPEFPAF